MSEKFRSRKNEASPLEDEVGDEEFVKGSHKKPKSRLRGIGRGGRKSTGSDEDDSQDIPFSGASRRVPYFSRPASAEVVTPEQVPVVSVESPIQSTRGATLDRAIVDPFPKFESRADLLTYIRNFLKRVPQGKDLESTFIPDDGIHALRSLGGYYQNAKPAKEGGKHYVRYKWKGEEIQLTHNQFVQILRDAVDPKKKNEGNSPRSAAKSSVRLNKEDWEAVNHAMLGMIPSQESDITGDPVFFGEEEGFEESIEQTPEGGMEDNSSVPDAGQQIETAEDVDTVPYAIRKPSVKSWLYIKSLKNRKFKNKGIFPQQLIDTLIDVGAVTVEYADAKNGVIRVAFKMGDGSVSNEEMNQLEAAEFLMDASQEYKDSDFVPEKKKKVVQSVKKGNSVPAPQGGDPVEGSNAQTLAEAMQGIAEQTESDEIAPDTKDDAKNPEVVPVGTLVDLEVEPTPHVSSEKRTEWTEQNMKLNAAARFESEFGISQAELAGVPGFEKLSAPQQKMVFENLVQSTYGRVKEETISRYSQTAEGRRMEAVDAYGRIAGRVWAGIREVFTKDFNTHKTEQEVADSVKKGGIKEHGDIIAQLTRSMANFGPRVHEDPATGGLLVDLVNIDFDRVHRRKEYKAISNLNSIAHEFAKMPAAWKEHTLGVDAAKANEWKVTQLFKAQFSDERKHQLIYEETSKAFAEAKAVLERTLREDKKSDQDIAKILLGVDQRVQQLQFIQTSPDAITELSNIQDKNIYYETAKSLVGKSGLGYMALGYASRTALTGLIGWFAAPVVSSGLAASRSWNKTAAELRERDRSARMGVTDTKEGSLNIVSAESLIKKTKALIYQYYKLSEQIRLRETTMEDPKELHAAMATTLNRLDERISFIRDKQNLNRVNYGARDTYIGRQVELYEILGEGAVIIQNEMLPIGNTVGEQIKRSTTISPENTDGESGINRSELKQRLSKFLAHKESSIDSKRRTYRRQELTAQALKAGGMALAGTFLAEYFRSGGGSGAAAEASRAGVAGSGPQTAVLENEFAPAVSGETSYEIKRGDTLTKILKEHMPRVTNLENAPAQERFLANVFKSLTPEELAEVGIRSGDVNKIYTGDTIDLERLEKIIEAKKVFVPAIDVAVDVKLPNSTVESVTEMVAPATGDVEIAAEKYINAAKMRSEYMEGVGEASDIPFQEIADLNQKEKVKVFDKLLLTHFFPDATVDEIKEMKVLQLFSPAKEHSPLEKELQTFFRIAKEPPLNIRPIKDETILNALHRVNIELSKYEETAKYNTEIQELFKKINKNYI